MGLQACRGKEEGVLSRMAVSSKQLLAGKRKTDGFWEICEPGARSVRGNTGKEYLREAGD